MNEGRSIKGATKILARSWSFLFIHSVFQLHYNHHRNQFTLIICLNQKPRYQLLIINHHHQIDTLNPWMTFKHLFYCVMIESKPLTWHISQPGE